jgi:hypothetical protein
MSTLNTPRSTPLLLLSSILTPAENRAADEIFLGIRPLPPDVPLRCELSPQGRFHDIRCLQPGQWLTGGIFTAVAEPLSSLLSSIGPLVVTWKVLDPEIFYAMAFTTTSYVFPIRVQKLVKEHTHVIFHCCIQDHWLIFYTALLSDGTVVLTSLNSFGGLGTVEARRHLIRILTARVPGGPTFPSTHGGVWKDTRRSKTTAMIAESMR